VNWNALLPELVLVFGIFFIFILDLLAKKEENNTLQDNRIGEAKMEKVVYGYFACHHIAIYHYAGKAKKEENATKEGINKELVSSVYLSIMPPKAYDKVHGYKHTFPKEVKEK